MDEANEGGSARDECLEEKVFERDGADAGEQQERGEAEE